MFTGIIEDIGSILSIKKSSGKWEFSIKTMLAKAGIREGDSIAIDGLFNRHHNNKRWFCCRCLS